MTGDTKYFPNMTESDRVQNQTCDCSIDEFKRAVFPVAYLLIFLMGLTANCASLWVFLRMCRKGRRLTTVNLYMVNLLVSDLMLVCTLPLRAAYYLLDSYWPFGDIACRLASYVFYINMYGSVYFLLALSVIRYMAVSHPFKFLRLDNGPWGWVGCVLIWVFVSLVSAPLLSSGIQKGEGGKIHCLELGKMGLDTMIILNSAAFVVGFALPFVVISVCYMCVLRSLCQPRAGRDGNRPSRRKSFALVGLGLLIFVVCFLPYHVVRTIFLEAEQNAQKNGCRDPCSGINGIRKAAVVTLCLAAGNSCLDPFLFFFVGENFRDICMRKARRSGIVERQAEAQELQVVELTEMMV
ncbi:cysteinyl leukotriene receptor 2 [Osmerus eperlanus]|uniref:cysteinyl leukotriene receptor 2 n=1 Tax=Osmerus eperlanus TaxID=29151 RepID=UPI002E155F13